MIIACRRLRCQVAGARGVPCVDALSTGSHCSHELHYVTFRYRGRHAIVTKSACLRTLAYLCLFCIILIASVPYPSHASPCLLGYVMGKIFPFDTTGSVEGNNNSPWHSQLCHGEVTSIFLACQAHKYYRFLRAQA